MEPALAIAAIKRLEERIAQTEGARLVREFAPVRASHRIFDANSQELGELLVLNASGEFAHFLWDVRNRAFLDAFLDEATRRLHNYVASTMSLVEHTRRVIRRTYGEGTNARREYDQRVATDFVESPEIRFVQDLRDLILHVDAIHVNARFEWSCEHGERRELLLARQRLIVWDQWSPPARQFLARETDDIYLDPLIRTYTATVSAFYNWLADWERAQHAEAYSELDRLQREAQAIAISGGLMDLNDPTTKRRSLREVKQAIDEARRASGVRGPAYGDETEAVATDSPDPR